LIDSEKFLDRLVLADECKETLVVLCLGTVDISAPHCVITMPHDDINYAHRLYEALREADATSTHRIIVETPPETSELWQTVLHRLHQAAASL